MLFAAKGRRHFCICVVPFDCPVGKSEMMRCRFARDVNTRMLGAPDRFDGSFCRYVRDMNMSIGIAG